MKQQADTNVVYDELKLGSNLTLDHLDQIAKDVKRTYFPSYHSQKLIEEQEFISEGDKLEIARLEAENDLMRKQIERILIAYNSRDMKVGYVQGFNSIVGALLYIFHQAKEEISKTDKKPAIDCDLKFDEEEVFYTFFGLMTILRWRERFFDGMTEVNRMCDDFSKRMEKEDPMLYEKFFENHVGLI